MARSKHGDINKEVELKSKAGFAFLCYTFGAMLYMIGFPSEYFIEDDTNQKRFGLWATCNMTTTECESLGGAYGWLAGARAFLTSGVVLLIVCMTLMAFYIGTPVMSRKTNIALLFGTTVVTVLVMLIGIVIFGAATTGQGSASWAYLLIIVGCIIYAIAAILTGLELCAPSSVKNRAED